MRHVSRRAAVVLLLAGLVLAGLLVFLIQYVFQAKSWAAFPGSPHVSRGNNLTAGTVTDRGGAEIRFVTKSGEEIRKFTLGTGYVAFAARKNGGGAIVYAAKNARLKEISVTSDGVAEVPAQIRCIGLSYAEYGDVKLLGVRNPYGYEYVYEVE